MRLLPGAEAVLAAPTPALPQPDQLCGPFSAARALRALTSTPPDVATLALAAGTRVWPHDVPQWRPDGAPFDTTGWDALPRAASSATSGTDAAGLARGIATCCPDVAVVPASGGDVVGLLGALLDAGRPVAVLANLLADLGHGPVGHFVVVLGLDGGLDGEHVVLADTYAELTEPGLPPGCRTLAPDDLGTALVDRGLLLLVPGAERPWAAGLVAAAGASDGVWST